MQYKELSKLGAGKLDFLYGQATAFILHKNHYCDVPDEIRIADALYLEGCFIAKITWGGYSIIYPSINAQADLFTYGPGKQVLDYGYDFIELCMKYKESLSYDRHAVDFFRIHGLFRPGETYFKEICRVKTGQGIVFYKNSFKGYVNLPIHTWEDTSLSDYKKGLINYIQLLSKEDANRREYLLFSGGRDSALLALLMEEVLDNGVELVHSVPHGVMIPDDTKRYIDFYSDFLKKDIKIIHYNYNDYNFDRIKYLCEKMPLAAHTSIGFDVMNSYVAENNGRSWTGQDADSMYSLGYTGSAVKEILSRYMIGDHNMRGLADIEGRTYTTLLSKLLAFAYNTKGKGVRVPQCIEDLRAALSEIKTSVPFTDSDFRFQLHESMSVQSARHLLYQDKMSFFVSGRDHRVAAYAGNPISNTVFPYSCAMMYFMHISIKRGLTEILRNKKMISDLIVEYIGRKSFRKLYPGGLFKTYAKGAKMESDILNESAYGKSIRLAGEYKGGILQEAINRAWEKEVMRIINYQKGENNENGDE